MKKQAQTLLIALTTLGALACSSAAVARDGLYIQGDIGLGHLKVDDSEKLRISNVGSKIKDSYKESGFMPRISIGSELGDGLRVAADFTHYKDMKNSYTTATQAIQTSSVKANGFGVSAIYDYDTGTEFTPYVGGRLSANKLKYAAGYTATGERLSSSTSKTKFGYGLLLGVAYRLDDMMTLDAGYRYNHLDSKLNAHEFSVGVRYYFN
ncbi:MAG: opacity family porin [Lautropia sp.]|nr:opacity family porin [Lautropia sp.]